MSRKQILISLTIIPIIGLLLGLAGATHSQVFQGTAIFLLCVACAFLLNWLAFIPAYMLQTEKFYDLIGSATYLTTVGLAAYLSSELDLRSMIIEELVVVWAVRLG